MKARCFRSIGSISLSALLIASTFVMLNSSAGATEPGEVSAASGANRFVVWSDSNPGNYEIFFRRSTDNGATWQAIKNLSDNPGQSSVPEIAVSGSNVYVVWLQLDAGSSHKDIFFRRSTDNGATWEPKISLSFNGMVGSSTPRVTSSGSNVYVVWDQGDPYQSDIYFRRSTDNGATWKLILNLSNNKHSYDEKISVSGSNVHVVWSKEIPGSSVFEIFFRRSTDGGATWKASVNLSNNPGPSRYSEIAVSGSNIYVVWYQQSATSSSDDIFFRRSIDNGATWKPFVNISSSGTVGGSVPQVMNSGSNVYVVWPDKSSGNYETLFRRSSDNGATWKPIINLSNNPGPSADTEISVSGSNVYVTWGQWNPDITLTDVFFRRSTDSGETWKTFKNLSQNGHSSEPQIADSGSSVYVVWIDHVSNNDDISFQRSTDNGATWTSVQDLSNNIGRSSWPRIGV
ncbi:MAG TPA: sialidase family protein [Nitrososphaera sp.]|jgi:hypothetical protein|nr:sialidase family protein [Nitrososphaera sp.]